MKIEKTRARDKKIRKRRYGMRVTGHSVFVIIGLMATRKKGRRAK